MAIFNSYVKLPEGIWCCNQTQGIDYQSVQRQGESEPASTKEPPSGMGGCWYGCDHVPSPSVGGWGLFDVFRAHMSLSI